MAGTVYYPVVAINKSGTNYTSSRNGVNIVYQPNFVQQAVVTMDNSTGLVTGVFSEEDLVTVKINSVSMLQGYITKINDRRLPGRKWLEEITVVDKGGYLAAKTIYENEYRRKKTTQTIFTNAAGAISGLSTNVSGSLTDLLGKEMFGTYVKDHWAWASEDGGADYYVDENFTLQAWPANSRTLTEGSTGSIYTIRDIAPSTANQLMVNHNYEYNFVRDVTTKYRSVYLTNGNAVTFPTNFDLMCDSSGLFLYTPYGKYFSPWIMPNTISGYDIRVAGSTAQPVISNKDVLTNGSNGSNIPTLSLQPYSAAQPWKINIFWIQQDGTGASWGIPYSTTPFTQLRMFFHNQMVSQVVTKIDLYLIDSGIGSTPPTKYWHRDIFPDLAGASGRSWTYLQYTLPVSNSGTSNGWDVSGTPTNINAMRIDFTPSTGWATSDYTSFGQVYFWGRLKSSQTGAGSPATQMYIVDNSMRDVTAMNTKVQKEQARTSQTATPASCTIIGNTDFRTPGYLINVDFSTTLGSAASLRSLRMDKITHNITAGVYTTTIDLAPPYARP